MLTVLVGRDRVERARTVVAVVFAVIALISLGQVVADRSASTGDAIARAAALDTARRFAVALTTYDYAHPDVQKRQLEQVADPVVVEQATAAVPDMRDLAATSIGDVAGISIASFNSGSASMLVKTDQVVSNNLVGRGRKQSGMLDCELHSRNGTWIVSSFHWAIAPSAPA